MNKPRVIAVLGMHRSGTSAVTRGLASLGVELGSDLLDSVSDQNPTGFFEDRWFLDISDRLLAALGMRWDSVRTIDEIEWQTSQVAALKVEACEGIRSRFGGFERFAFKNPRTARLLPFWSEIFGRCHLDPSYVLVVRHPLSVASSLSARNGFHPAKSHLLWLLHVTDAILNTSGALRACIDYDDLLAEPAAVIAQLGRDLKLPPEAVDAEDLQRYTGEFLSEDLRHSAYAPEELPLDPAVSELSQRAFELLRQWTRRQLESREPRLQRGFRRIADQLAAVAPWLAEMNRLDVAIETMDRDKRHLRHHLERLEVEHENTQSELRERVRRVARFEERVRGTERLLRQRRQELEAATGALGREIASRASAEETKRVLASQLASSERDLALERDRAEGLARDIAVRAAALETERRERQAVEARLERAQSRRPELETKLVRERGLRQEAEASLVHQLARGRELQETLAEREAALANGEQALAAKERGLAALRAEIEAGRARTETALASLVQLEGATKAERERLEGELAATARALDSEQVQREAADARVADARARLAELERHQVGTLVAAVSRLPRLVATFRETRTWRVARRLQRSIDGLRGRPGSDGAETLARCVDELFRTAARRPLDLSQLREKLAVASACLDGIRSAELMRVVRGLIGIPYLLRLRPRPPGSAELLAQTLADASSFLEPLGSVLRASAGAGPTSGPTEAPVDVVVPVFDSREEVMACLESVLASTPRTPYHLVVVDDASTDAELARALDALAKEGSIELVRNVSNRGFTGSANRGLALHPDRDVILLNSDTLVHGDWIDRLRAAAYSEDEIGTATPFSNNAEICSYPLMCRANPPVPGLALANIDELFARANFGRTTEIPTAVGFCTYLRRDCLVDTGYFDEERFPRGYGEENDFSMRARAKGWRHVLCGDAFVYHEGGASFGEEKVPRIDQGLQTLSELHPTYLGEVHGFIAADPVKQLRRRVDIARIGGAGVKVLLLNHNLAGGTLRHVGDLADRMLGEGARPYLLTAPDHGVMRLEAYGGPETPNLRWDAVTESGDMIECLRILGIDHLHFHHTLGLSVGPESILDLPARLGVSYDFTLHDYFPMCPRVNLIDGSGRYCREPDATTCTSCIRRNGSPVGRSVDVERWRARYGEFLGGARRVFAPSADVATRMARYFPDLCIRLRPHRDVLGQQRDTAVVRAPGERLRVAIVGAIGQHKGSDVLYACARDAENRDLPIEYCVVGFTDQDSELAGLRRVTITGAYDENDALDRLRATRCHLAFFASVWPETFSYTLSIALQGRMFPVAFDLGAIAERIRAVGWGELLPLEATAAQINDRLLSLEIPPAPAVLRTGRPGSVGSESLAAYYEGVFTPDPEPLDPEFGDEGAAG